MSEHICPICGEGALEHTVKPMTYEYKGQHFTIDQPAEWCGVCGEGIISPADDKAVQTDIQEAKARIDGVLPPSEIKNIRQKILHLNQAEASNLFGGGVNAFNRYENGVNPIPRPLSILLMLLKNHPEQIREIMAFNQMNNHHSNAGQTKGQTAS